MSLEELGELRGGVVSGQSGPWELGLGLWGRPSLFAPPEWEKLGNFSLRCGGGSWEVKHGEEVEQLPFRGVQWGNPAPGGYKHGL